MKHVWVGTLAKVTTNDRGEVILHRGEQCYVCCTKPTPMNREDECQPDEEEKPC